MGLERTVKARRTEYLLPSSVVYLRDGNVLLPCKQLVSSYTMIHGLAADPKARRQIGYNMGWGMDGWGTGVEYRKRVGPQVGENPRTVCVSAC